MSKTLKASLRKAIAGFLTVTTIVWLSGVIALIPVAQAATIVDGDVIQNPSAAGDAQFDVYIVKIVGVKKFKRLVLNPQVFASYGHLKWENIKTVTSAEMSEYKTSAIVRVESDPKVLALAPNGDAGSKSWLNVAAADFTTAGGDWDSVYVINAVDGANYAVAADVTTATQVGTFLTAGTLPGVVTPTPTPVAGAVTVYPATDTPASGTIISGAVTAQAGADLLHFTVSGTGTVTGVALKRVGVSADATLSNVYLFDGATRITDAASVSTGGAVNFNNASGLFTVSGTKTISVKSDIAVNSAGQTVGIQLTGVTLKEGTIGGTLPISGNIHSIASATLATVAFSAAVGSGNTDPGTGLVLWQGTTTVGTREALLTRLALRQVGSIVSADINNFKLLVDGAEVATVAALDSNGYVTFTLSKALATGSRTLKVIGDVVGGSGRTVQLSLRGAYDISTTDTQYGVGITATVTAATFPFGPAAFTISNGTMTVVKATGSRSANLTRGASDQSLATYTFTAYGESIKVETLRVGMITTGGTATNVTIQDVKIMVNGVQAGTTTSVPANTAFATDSGTQFTTNFTVVPGTPATVEIRANMVDTTDAGGDTTDDIAAGTVTAVQPVLIVSTGNGVPQVTITAINVPITTNVAGNNLTIAAGSISVALTSAYGNRTIVVPQTAYKIGSYVVTGNSTEAVNLNTIYVGFTAGSTATEATDLSSLYVTYGGVSTTPKGSVSATILNGNSWSINKSLAVNEAMTFDVYATIASSLSTNAIITTLAVAGTTAQSGITVYADTTSSNTTLDAGFTGQTITGGTGSITATRDASTPSAALLDDTGTIKTASFKFTAVNDTYTLTDLVLAITNASAVANVIIKDGTSTLLSKPGATAITFSGLSVPVTENTPKVIDVYVELATVGSGAGTSGSAVTTDFTSALASATSTGVNGAVADSTSAGNALYVYKAIPVVTQVSLPSATLTTGTKTIAKFKVESTGGTIAWKQVLIDLTKSGDGTANGTDRPTVSNIELYDVTTGNTIVTAAEVIQNAKVGAGTAAGTPTSCLADAASCEILISVGTNADDNVEEQVSGSKTYEVRATIGGTVAVAGYYVNTVIAQNTGAKSDPAVYTSTDNSLAADNVSFVWSDLSATSHDTGTADWNNDYLVKSLPFSTQGLVY